MENKRPFGITLIGQLDAWCGGIVVTFATPALIFFIIAYIYSSLTGYQSEYGYAQWMGAGIFVSSIVFIPALLILIAGRNLLKLKNWARKLNIFIDIALPFYAIIIFASTGMTSLKVFF